MKGLLLIGFGLFKSSPSFNAAPFSPPITFGVPSPPIHKPILISFSPSVVLLSLRIFSQAVMILVDLIN